MITLDLSCGKDKTPNSIGVDITKIKGVDVLAEVQCAI